MNWPQATSIVTDRLLLEPLEVHHATEMVETLSSPDLYTYIGGTSPSLPELERLYALQLAGASPTGDAGWLNWIVREANRSTAIGYVQATVTMADTRNQADIAWVIGADHQRRGFATEAARAMIAWLADRQVTELRAAIHPGNESSNRVAERLGMNRPDAIDDGEVIWHAELQTGR
ncbi:GNAT family N-acetyltransferase [Brevibacterium siliguriense]|uniref:GNAT family N-acetyltransferase n=1 Tax=Brevibacterium siliguriense TaxID=1136497 RepID=UPI001E3D4987|nr:GNAT family N-acetyltransferase [Brevibacterium siliguriense]